MEITTSAPIRATPPAGPPSRGTVSASTDFEMFLKLLTTQIRNQDPLEPADSTEYTAQLATFSNVEQSVQTNELLRGMMSRLDQQQAGAAASWIGMEVRHTGPIALDMETRTLSFDIPSGVDRAELVVTTPDGTERARRPVEPGATSLTWPAPGLDLQQGIYRVHVEASAGAQSLDPVPVSHFAEVSEVLLEPDGISLGLASGVRLPVSSLDAIRRPGAG
jgi:flagellar basal-body rod modification protein FlgD